MTDTPTLTPNLDLLERLAEFAMEIPADRFRFGISLSGQDDGSSYPEPTSQKPAYLPAEAPCGTVGCLIGHAGAAGVLGPDIRRHVIQYRGEIDFWMPEIRRRLGLSKSDYQFLFTWAGYGGDPEETTREEVAAHTREFVAKQRELWA